MRIASIIRNHWILCVLLLAPVVADGRARFSWEDHQIIDKNWPKAVESSTGLLNLLIREGEGPHPKPGQNVSVLYRGMLLDGTVFDESVDPEKPFTFRHGRGEVIKAWEEGISQMRVGEIRMFIVPAELAYGSRGRPPDIPRNAALRFEVELVKIEPVK